MAALTQEQEEQILQGFSDGLSRNEVARRVGVSKSTVDTRAKRNGHTWDRAAPMHAVQAMQADHSVRRTQLREKALILMERLYEQAITQPHEPKEIADLARAIMAAVNADYKLGEQEKSSQKPAILIAFEKIADTPSLPGE